MEIASIKGDTVHLLYHPAETAAEVGQQYAIVEPPQDTEGLIVQVISNDTLEYSGLQQEMIQKLLEERATIIRPLDREQGMGEIRSLKLATAKIRKRVTQGKWAPWDGWIPTRNVHISRVDAATLMTNIVPVSSHPLSSFVSFDGSLVTLDGPGFNMVNVIAGVKGSGKSHLAKHLLLALTARSVPCVVFDINGEYVQMPNAVVLQWGSSFRPNLAQVGHEMLALVIRAVYPLPETSQNAFESSLPVQFGRRQAFCHQRNEPFTVDVGFLRTQTWSTNQYIQDAIGDRLRVVENLQLFMSNQPQQRPPVGTITDFAQTYEQACSGHPIVFNMQGLGSTMQNALVRATNKTIEDICATEALNKGRFPYVFYEEAHFYISPDAILNIITRGRHIGIASTFITNTPQHLPDTVFRQLDNLFLLSLTHRDDIRNVSKNSFTDEDTIQSFATRMPKNHALIVGNVTDRYPLVVRVLDLPPHVPTTGRTRSTWDRFNQS